MSDRNNQPDQQIRDTSYTINTPSLMQLGSEVVPPELLRDLYNQEWIATEKAPKPIIVVQDEIYQANTDSIVIAMENYQEVPLGHRHEFVDIEVSLTVSIRSRMSRARTYDLMAECRRITYVWMLALRPFHCLYWDGWMEDPGGPNNFSGIMRVRMTAGAIPIFLRHASGATSPNTEPDLFPADI